MMNSRCMAVPPSPKNRTDVSIPQADALRGRDVRHSRVSHWSQILHYAVPVAAMMAELHACGWYYVPDRLQNGYHLG
jgi:hypothetical protein